MLIIHLVRIKLFQLESLRYNGSLNIQLKYFKFRKQIFLLRLMELNVLLSNQSSLAGTVLEMDLNIGRFVFKTLQAAVV